MDLPRHRTFCLACFLTVPFCSAYGQNEPVNVPDKSTAGNLETIAPQLMKEASIPGLSLAVIRDDATYWVQSFGRRGRLRLSP